MERLSFESDADPRTLAEALYTEFPEWIQTNAAGERYTSTSLQMSGSSGFLLYPATTPVEKILAVIASVAPHKQTPPEPEPPTTVVVPVIMPEKKSSRDWRVLIGKGWIWNAR